MKPQLEIVSIGMVTAVGLDAQSSCAAMRARLDGFQETRFLAPGGDRLIGAPVTLPRDWIGEKRLAHLAAAAIIEAFDEFPETRGDAALILCLAEEGRPGRLPRDSSRFAARIAEITGFALPRTLFVTHGRPSGHAALEQARRLLAEKSCSYVLICGVDSYLTGQTVGHYLAERRLLTAENPEGFIPGEAAAAILCARPGSGGSLRIAGVGLAREPASIYNKEDRPFRADGMTTAYKAAFAEAGCLHSDIVLKIGDLPGETFWFKQTALAMMRTQRELTDVQPIWPIAASIGNIGAAAVPLMIGWAYTASQKRYGPRGRFLIEASGDDGAAGALVALAS